MASASSNSGGASNTEMASAIAYSAIPPSAFLVMATTRLPEPALGTLAGGIDDAAHVHAERERRRRGDRDQVAPAAVDVVEVERSGADPTRTSPGPGSGRSMRLHGQHLARLAVAGHLQGPHLCHALLPSSVQPGDGDLDAGSCPERVRGYRVPSGLRRPVGERQ